MAAFALVVIASAQLVASASAEKRVALVVGNAAYVNVAPLTNSANDARLMAETLRGLGFALVGGAAQTDLDKAGFDTRVQQFGALLQGADVGLFYYAGHGVQVRGTNYLVPVGANPTREADIDFQMLDTNLVLRQMEGSGTKLNLVILDACRNNPFGGRGLRATSGGLAQMQAPEGTLISFATQPGNVAQDGSDGNSPYTKALSQTIRRPGLGIFDAFNEVGLAVMQATGNAQQPWVSTSPIKGSFHFAEPSPGVAAPVAAVPSPAADEIFWLAIRDSKVSALFEEFLRKFPSSQRGPEARAQLEALNKVAVLTPAPNAVAAALPAFAGVYSGSVSRSQMATHKKEETRRYTVTFDADGRGGKLAIKGGSVDYEMSFVGQMKDGRTFVGKTRPADANIPKNYIPDDITLEFSSDGKSLRWHHEDGKIEGSGMLARS